MDTSRSTFEDPQENLNLGLEASEYIHNNYYREITLQSVADYLNISPRHVNRVFYGMFGTTFSKALTLLRFSYAKKNIRARLDGASKIISLPVSKKWQNRFPIFIRKAVLLLVLFFGGEHPRWSDFEKPALKRPGNPYEYWKIVVRWANTVWKEFINLKSKEILSKMRIPGLE